MLILALDSSSCVASVALVRFSLASNEGEVLHHHHEQHARNDSSSFFKGLEKALEKHPSLDRIVVGLGPGSYNGLRVSMAAAQGMASALGKELIGIPSFLALEQAASSCWVIGDARGGLYWLASARAHTSSQAPVLLAPEAIAEVVKKSPELPLVAYTALPKLSQFPNIVIQSPNAVLLAKLGYTAPSPKEPLELLYLKSPHTTLPRPL